MPLTAGNTFRELFEAGNLDPDAGIEEAYPLLHTRLKVNADNRTASERRHGAPRSSGIWTLPGMYVPVEIEALRGAYGVPLGGQCS